MMVTESRNTPHPDTNTQRYLSALSKHGHRLSCRLGAIATIGLLLLGAPARQDPVWNTRWGRGFRFRQLDRFLMPTAATMAFVGGLIMIVDGGILWMRSKTWIRRQSDRWRTLGTGFRRMVGLSCWVGVFLLSLALVLVSLSFAYRRVRYADGFIQEYQASGRDSQAEHCDVA
jgi:hypothetical protein